MIDQSLPQFDADGIVDVEHCHGSTAGLRATDKPTGVIALCTPALLEMQGRELWKV